MVVESMPKLLSIPEPPDSLLHVPLIQEAALEVGQPLWLGQVAGAGGTRQEQGQEAGEIKMSCGPRTLGSGVQIKSSLPNLFFSGGFTTETRRARRNSCVLPPAPASCCLLPPASCHLPPATCLLLLRLPPAPCLLVLPPASCSCHLPPGPASCVLLLPPASCHLPAHCSLHLTARICVLTSRRIFKFCPCSSVDRASAF